jgi:hypothetical protein
MQRRALGLGLLALLALGVGAWLWTRVTPPVTEAEARRYLARLVAAAQDHDLERLCHLNGAYLNCHKTLEYIGGPDTVPHDPPTVVGTRYHPKDPGGTAGRVLVVEGVDGRGRHYRTEVFVFRENRFHFKATNGVYWSGARFIEDGLVQPTGPASDARLRPRGPH